MNLQKISKKILYLMLIIMLLGLTIVPMGQSFAAATKYTQTLKSGIDTFPKEYQEALKKLKELHPNWTFEAYYTGLFWNTAVLNETATHGRNRVIKSADDSWKCSCGNVASGYACASDGIVKYYLDARNFLNEINIFQFLEISYNSKIHNLAGIKSAVKGTFLDKTITYKKTEIEEIEKVEELEVKKEKVEVEKEYTTTYAEIILAAAEKSNMSPYSIVTKIIQEVGTKGSSSVSGTYKGYEGYYNFYNLGAYDTGNAIVNGLKYAKDKGWDNQYDAIIDGAKEIANSYTNAGQNTAYFYKWDVVGDEILKSGKTQKVSSSDMFWHQYMTNVQDPTSQSKSLYNTYASNKILDKSLNFIIPVYEDMPEKNEMPTGFSDDTENLYYVNCTDGLRVRNKASTSGKVLTTLYKNTKVQMITKEYTTANGIVWDKIKLSNGVIGYVADKYLTPCKTEVKEEEKVIEIAKTTENLKLRKTAGTSGVLLTTIPKGSKVDILDKNIGELNGYIWYKVKYGSYTGYVASEYLKIETEENKDEEIVINKEYAQIEGNTIIVTPEATLNNITTSGVSGKLQTSSIVAIGENNYTVIMLADANGDGKISAVDYMQIKNHIMDTSELSSNYKKAADVNRDDKISAVDYMQIKNYIMGTSKIEL